MRVRRVVAAMSLVDIGALDLTPGESLGASIAARSVCPSYGLPGSALACSTNWPPGARALVVTTETLTPIYGPRPRCKPDPDKKLNRSAPIYPASNWSFCPEPIWISARFCPQ